MWLPILKYGLWCLSTGLAFAGAWLFKFTREDDAKTGRLVLTRHGKIAFPVAVGAFAGALLLQLAQDRATSDAADQARIERDRLTQTLDTTRAAVTNLQTVLKGVTSLGQPATDRKVEPPAKPLAAGPTPAMSPARQPATRPERGDTRQVSAAADAELAPKRLAKPVTFNATNKTLGFEVQSVIDGAAASDGRTLTIAIDRGVITLTPQPTPKVRFIKSIRAALMGLNDQAQPHPVAYSPPVPIEKSIPSGASITLEHLVLPIALNAVPALAGHWIYFQIFEKDSPDAAGEAFSVVPTPHDIF